MAEISPALYRAGSGEPMVLLHGFTATWRNWAPLLGALVARYEVIAPSLPGHDGGPAYEPDASLSFSVLTDAVERQLDELGVGTAHMVGNSMGGGLALELAKRGRARSVVGLAPGCGWTEGDGEGPRLGRLFARQLEMARRSAPFIAKIMARPGSRRLALREVMRNGELVAPADAVDLSLSALRCTLAEAAIQALHADRAVALTDLDRIACPVLLASPQFDRILPPERHAPRFKREIPGVEAVTLRGCGHVPMWDDTRLVLRTITQFVDRHIGTSSPAELLTSAAT